MMKKILFFLLLNTYNVFANKLLLIDPKQAQEIGKKIWHNECSGTIEGLTSWNPGEEFASMGIGHFIWYPKKRPIVSFKESFPSLITHLKNHKKKLPIWLLKNSYCPWQSREEFLAAYQSKEMQELRKLLEQTIDLQTQFIIKRLDNAVIKFKKKLSPKIYKHVQEQFYRVAQSPNGLYALIDYANFKGIGLDEKKDHSSPQPKEAYNNQGWGLVCVLQSMKGGPEVGASALREFNKAAKYVLELRIKNSPPERNESRWLKGWFNRLDTYLQ